MPGSTDGVLSPRLRRRILTAATIAYVLYYLHGVRRLRLHHGQGDPDARSRMERILSRCPALSKGPLYWPPFYAPSALGQFLILGLKELRARFLSRSPYERTVCALKDGTQLGLDWAVPETPLDGAPVVVMLHGAFQDAASATMVDLATGFVARGLPTVVMNRRGYGGLPLADGAPIALFGFDEDLDAVLVEVARRFPGRGVALIGFSCGAGFAGRYGHTSALSAWAEAPAAADGRGPPKPKLLCTVCLDPGYNCRPEGAVARISPPYSWILTALLKWVYVFRHRAALSKRSPSSPALCRDLLSPRAGLAATYKGLRRLSGEFGSSAWLDIQQPRIGETKVPTLLINSVDDPILVWENVEEAKAEMLENANCVLAELRRGSHGCKYDFFGLDTRAEPMIAEFILSAWRELRAQQRREAYPVGAPDRG